MRAAINSHCASHTSVMGVGDGSGGEVRGWEGGDWFFSLVSGADA